MRNKTSFWKSSLAALLVFVMVLGIFSALGKHLAIEKTVAPATQAEEGQQTNITGDYITLPITIRDFAADGMLFEYNEVNRETFTRNDDGTVTWTPITATKTDRLYSYTNAAYQATYNPPLLGSEFHKRLQCYNQQLYRYSHLSCKCDYEYI